MTDPGGVLLVEDAEIHVAFTTLAFEREGLGDSLRVARDGCRVQLTWWEPPWECSETFRVWRGAGDRPNALPPSFPVDPAFEDVTAWDEDSNATKSSSSTGLLTNELAHMS